MVKGKFLWGRAKKIDVYYLLEKSKAAKNH